MTEDIIVNMDGGVGGSWKVKSMSGGNVTKFLMLQRSLAVLVDLSRSILMLSRIPVRILLKRFILMILVMYPFLRRILQSLKSMV